MPTRFGPFILDRERRELRRGPDLVHLTAKAFELLALLVRESSRMVSKRQIMAELWPDVAVSEGSLSVLVAEVRRALGDNAREPQYLRTVHGYGLAFCGKVSSPPDEAGAERGGPALCRVVVWGLHEFQLGQGEIVIGRDADCELSIDLASLSRRHALLRIEPGLAVLEDLKSKNGSIVNGERISGPRVIRDGDEIRLGGALLSFHWRPQGADSETKTSPARGETTTDVRKRTRRAQN